MNITKIPNLEEISIRKVRNQMENPKHKHITQTHKNCNIPDLAQAFCYHVENGGLNIKTPKGQLI